MGLQENNSADQEGASGQGAPWRQDCHTLHQRYGVRLDLLRRDNRNPRSDRDGARGGTFCVEASFLHGVLAELQKKTEEQHKRADEMYLENLVCSRYSHATRSGTTGGGWMA